MPAFRCGISDTASRGGVAGPIPGDMEFMGESPEEAEASMPSYPRELRRPAADWIMRRPECVGVALPSLTSRNVFFTVTRGSGP
jgi:hypothetical protein